MVVAGISGLVVAATEPGSGFWEVPVLGPLKRRLVGAARRPRIIIRQILAKGQAKAIRSRWTGSARYAAPTG